MPLPHFNPTTNREEIRFPLNFTSAKITIDATTSSGAEVRLEVKQVVFREPDDAAIVEVPAGEDDIVENPNQFPRTSRWFLEIGGEMVSEELGAMYTVTVKE